MGNLQVIRLDGDAMLYGAGAIAEFLGIGRRQVYYLVRQKKLPFWKEGRVVCARRDSIRAWVRQRDAGANQP